MRKLSRYSEHRMSMLKNLSISLFKEGRIVTTLARAKELRRFADPMITRAKVESLASRRILLSRLHNNKDIVNKLFKIAQSNKDRPGGYISYIRCGFRSDSGEKALVRIIDYPTEEVVNDQGNK